MNINSNGKSRFKKILHPISNLLFFPLLVVRKAGWTACLTDRKLLGLRAQILDAARVTRPLNPIFPYRYEEAMGLLYFNHLPICRFRRGSR